jgi:hypothetical protein
MSTFNFFSSRIFMLGSLYVTISVLCVSVGHAAVSQGELDVDFNTALEGFSEISTDLQKTPVVDYGKYVPSGSDTGVRYSTGHVTITEDDIVGEGRIPWGHRRTYYSGAMLGSAAVRHGSRWMATQFPFLKVTGSGVGETCQVFTSAFGSVSFKNLALIHFGMDALTKPNATTFIYADSKGYKSTFAQYGGYYRLQSYADPAGNTITMAWATNGYDQLLRAWEGGTAAAPEIEYSYEYGLPTTNPTFITAVVYKIRVAGTLTTVRRAEYEYYASGDAGSGGVATLKRVLIKDGSSGVIARRFYRYHDPMSTGAGSFNYGAGAVGYLGVMKYLITPRTYERVVAPGSGITDPASATDAQLDTWADRKWTFDNTLLYGTGASSFYRWSLSSEITHGEPGVDGAIERRFDYAQRNISIPMSNYRPANPLTWKSKTVEHRFIAGSEVLKTIRYFNGADEAILESTEEVGASPKKWIDFYRYDGQGRVIFHATPTAMTGYDEAKDDLVWYPAFDGAGNASYIRDSQGLITQTIYATTTTATSTAPGDVTGLLQHEQVQQGELSIPQFVSSKGYYARHR